MGVGLKVVFALLSTVLGFFFTDSGVDGEAANWSADDQDEGHEDPDDLAGGDYDQEEPDMTWKHGALVYFRAKRGKHGETLMLIEKLCRGSDSRWICAAGDKSLQVVDLRDRSRVTGRPMVTVAYEPPPVMSNADMAKAIFKAKGMRNWEECKMTFSGGNSSKSNKTRGWWARALDLFGASGRRRKSSQGLRAVGHVFGASSVLGAAMSIFTWARRSEQ